MIIVDTNVLSEMMRPQLDPSVEVWLASIDAGSLYYTTITRAEIRYGLARLSDGRRRADLTIRAEGLFADAADRLCVFDAAAADRYGRIVAGREARGLPISVPDAQIAAIVAARDASVATRNTADFMHCGIAVINPWTA